MSAPRRIPRAWKYLGLLGLLLALAAIPVVRHLRERVSWAEVLQAVARQQTIKGVAHVTARDGSEWACALWAGRQAGGRLAASTLLVPVRAKPGQQPGPDVVMLCQAIDLTAGLGLLTRLAAQGVVTAGRVTTWGGSTVLEVEPPTPPEVVREHPLRPARWRFYLDPKTRLVRGLDLSLGATVAARAEYQYNLPLPKSFRPGLGPSDTDGQRGLTDPRR